MVSLPVFILSKYSEVALSLAGTIIIPRGLDHSVATVTLLPLGRNCHRSNFATRPLFVDVSPGQNKANHVKRVRRRNCPLHCPDRQLAYAAPRSCIVNC